MRNVMSRLHLDRSVLRALATASLAVFLIGSNYCLVGALGGGFADSPACHSTHVRSERSSCCHGARPSRERRAPAMPEHSLPCCMVAAAPIPIQIEKVDSGASMLAGMPELAPSVPSAPAATWRGLDRHGSGPPASLQSRAPLSLRAPPLA
jgi:hypothetical protein